MNVDVLSSQELQSNGVQGEVERSIATYKAINFLVINGTINETLAHVLASQQSSKFENLICNFPRFKFIQCAYDSSASCNPYASFIEFKESMEKLVVELAKAS